MVVEFSFLGRRTATVGKHDFSGQRVVVMGLGGFGGGAGVARWLARQGADVLVTDVADQGSLEAAVRSLDDCDIEFRLGGHDPNDLDRADLLVVNPAVSKDKSGFFQDALRRSIGWTTEINLFLERCPARVIGVTGTAGKSTAVALIHAVLEGSIGDGSCYLGGNLGESLLDDLGRMTAKDVVVLELSSFQLHDIPLIIRRPDVAVYVEIWPNHLDRHGTFEKYLECKLNMIRGADSGTPVVMGLEDGATSRLIAELCEQWSLRAMPVEDALADIELKLRGAHNMRLARCAATVGTLFGVQEETIRRNLGAFAGLAHRMQFVGCYGGVEYYNDSKSTNPRCASAAVRSFDKPVIALVGGKASEATFDVLESALRSDTKATICFGPAGKIVQQSLARNIGISAGNVGQWFATLEEAVVVSRAIANAGDVVLLSPGFQSYDEFSNYERRGDAFISLVRSVSD